MKRRNPALLTLSNPSKRSAHRSSKTHRAYHRALTKLARSVPRTTNAAELRDEAEVRDVARAYGVQVFEVADDLLNLWGEQPRRGNPAKLSAAAAAYRKFHGIEPKKLRQLGGSGGALVALGDLLEVVYRPTKGQRRGPAFVHKFGRGAVLAATPDGAQLVLVPAPGRPFRVDWERGIVG